MNANIAELIMGLDDVTSAFSKDFDDMRSKTGWESFVGIFSDAKSESMRQERMRVANIDDKLQDLISKSDIIVKLLEGQLLMLEEQKEKVESNLTGTLDEREAVVGELERLRAEIMGMNPKIITLENKISVEQDAAIRTRLETELAELNTHYNAMVQDEQVKLANSQTLERYIEKGKTWVDSLQNQAATQMVLINKLQTDTRQRVVLYDALSKSLKTELRPCFRTLGYFTPVHERGTKWDTIDGSIRTSIRQQRLSGFMNRARHRAALPGSLVSPARS